MNKPNTEIVKKKIIVIESLREIDKKTGSELYADLLRYKELKNNDVVVDFYTVSSLSEFSVLLKDINSKMKAGEVFTLHFETHGSSEGIELNSLEVVKWKDFFDLIRPINIKMGHLLVIIMAMCKGGALVSHHEIEKRAPYKAFVASFKDIMTDDITRGFLAFYENYNHILDIFNAYEAMCIEVDGTSKLSSKSTFWMFTEEQILEKVVDLDRDLVHLNKMISYIQELEYRKGNYISLAMAEDFLRSEMHERYVKYKSFHCFHDLYP